MCTLPPTVSIPGISTYHLATREIPYVDRQKFQVEHPGHLLQAMLPTQYERGSIEKYNFLFDASSAVKTYVPKYLVILVN